MVGQKTILLSITLQGHVKLRPLLLKHLVRDVPESLRPCVWVVAIGLIVPIAAAKAASERTGC